MFCAVSSRAETTVGRDLSSTTFQSSHVLLTHCKAGQHKDHASRRDGAEAEQLIRYGPKSSSGEGHNDGDGDPMRLMVSGVLQSSDRGDNLLVDIGIHGTLLRCP